MAAEIAEMQTRSHAQVINDLPALLFWGFFTTLPLAVGVGFLAFFGGYFIIYPGHIDE